MEEHYQKQDYQKNYEAELSKERKESILRDIYNSVHLFYGLVYKAEKESITN